MIDYQKSAEMKGMSVKDFKAHLKRFPTSCWMVWRICDACKKGKIVQWNGHKEVCQGCSMKTDEYCKKQAEKSTWRKPTEAGLKKVAKYWTFDKRKGASERRVGEKNYNFGYKMPESIKERCRNTMEEMLEKMTPDELKEYSILMSCNAQGISRDEWDGFAEGDQPHLKPTAQCIQINERFKGSNAHHITPSIVIFIPTELHRYIYHNIKTGYNMGAMNMLALQFINGEL